MNDWSCCNPAGQCERGHGCPAGGACHHRPDCADTHCPGHPGDGASHDTPSDMPKPNWLGGIAVAALFFAAIYITQQPDEPEQATDQPSERMEAMKASGLLFMSRSPVRLTRDSRGVPQLTLRLVHRIANRQTEAWTLVWSGQAAADFFAHHGEALTAGQPLHVTASHLRAHAVGQLCELQGVVEACELAPRLHEVAA